MAFIAEDGIGIADANAYISLTFADDFHTDRGHTAWAALTEAEKQFSIIKASEYVDKRFGKKFRGYRQTRTQGLEWPRINAYDNDGYSLSGEDDIPRQLKKAVAEYAIRAAIYNILAPDPLRPVPGQSLEDGAGERDTTIVTGIAKRVMNKIGPIETEVEYSSSGSRLISDGARSIQSSLLDDFIIPQYPEADLWIEELLKSGNITRLSRGD